MFVVTILLFSPGLQGRYSFVGAQPAIEIIAKENKVTIMDHEEGSTVVKIVDDPISVAKEIVEGLSPQFIGELPDVFCGMISHLSL